MLETKSLILLTADDDRDNAPFLAMLKADGNFRDLCGLDYSDDNLMLFDRYLTKEDVCRYAIFEKAHPEQMIGYVGLYGEEVLDLEFYIQKEYRNRGYCTEAVMAFLEAFDSGILMIPAWEKDRPEAMQASTLSGNEASIRVLEKCGFHNITGNGLLLSLRSAGEGETYMNSLIQFERRLSIVCSEKSDEIACV